MKNVFLTLHEDKKAIPLLQRLKIGRFAEGDDSVYDTVRAMQAWIKRMREKEL